MTKLSSSMSWYKLLQWNWNAKSRIPYRTWDWERILNSMGSLHLAALHLANDLWPLPSNLKFNFWISSDPKVLIMLSFVMHPYYLACLFMDFRCPWFAPDFNFFLSSQQSLSTFHQYDPWPNRRLLPPITQLDRIEIMVKSIFKEIDNQFSHLFSECKDGVI